MSSRIGFFKSNREQVSTLNHFMKPEKLKLEIEAKLKETKNKNQYLSIRRTKFVEKRSLVLFYLYRNNYCLELCNCITVTSYTSGYFIQGCDLVKFVR